MYKSFKEQNNEYKNKLNKAILNIILESTKKNTKDEHKFVKENGYEIYKWAGCWHVKNPKTNKSVSGGYIWKYPKGNVVEISLYGCKNRYFDNKDVVKIDIVNYLNKPINNVYKDIIYPRNTESKAINKYKTLNHLKWNINYHKENLDRKYKEINMKLDDIKRIQDEIRKEIDIYNDAQKALDDYKLKIGL